MTFKINHVFPNNENPPGNYFCEGTKILPNTPTGKVQNVSISYPQSVPTPLKFDEVVVKCFTYAETGEDSLVPIPTSGSAGTPRISTRLTGDDGGTSLYVDLKVYDFPEDTPVFIEVWKTGRVRNVILESHKTVSGRYTWTNHESKLVVSNACPLS